MSKAGIPDSALILEFYRSKCAKLAAREARNAKLHDFEGCESFVETAGLLCHDAYTEHQERLPPGAWCQACREHILPLVEAYTREAKRHAKAVVAIGARGKRLAAQKEGV